MRPLSDQGEAEEEDRFFPWALAGLVLGALGVAIRVSNALVSPVGTGFDAAGNWRYIARLMQSWALPAPGDDWATSHPPLFYYLSAGLGRALGYPDPALTVLAIRLASTAVGLLTVCLAVALVLRVDPGNRRRALLAGGLLLFLPAHVYMSAMLSEEILAAGLTSLAVVATAWSLESSGQARARAMRAGAVGVAGGLALLTKLSGLLVLLTAAASYALWGIRRRQPRRALSTIAALGLVAMLVGGWYYANNRIQYGYFYPQDLPAHSLMFSMPPGARTISDYWYFPIATFTDPQLLSPSLVHSVWGATYTTLWFDGHRHFLPRTDVAVQRIGTLILVLALLPSVAFAVGLARGVRRMLAGAAGTDTPLVLLVGITLAGYVAFTWSNPWYAAVTGSYLLGLSVPFAFYASEVLDRWTRTWRTEGGRTGESTARARAALVWVTLGLLLLSVTATFSFGLAFEKTEGPGLPWKPPHTASGTR